MRRRTVHGLILGVSILFCVVLFIFESIPIITMKRSAPPGTVGIPIHRWYIDYYTYTMFIREGSAGVWSVPALYPEEKSSTSAVYAVYILLGHIAAVFRMPPDAMYHVARVAVAAAFFVSLYVLASQFLKPPWNALAPIAGLFTTPPIFLFGYPIGNIWRVSQESWGTLSPWIRIDGNVHHQFGIALFIFGMSAFLAYVKTRKTWLYPVSLLTVFISAVSFPPPSLTLLVIIPGVCIAEAVTKLRKQPSTLFKDSILMIGYLAVMGIAFVFLKSQTDIGFPWNQWSLYDIQAWNYKKDFDLGFAVGGGIWLLLAIPFLVRSVVKSSNIGDILLTYWIIAPYLLLPFATNLSLSKIRFGMMANYIPLGIVTVRIVSLALSGSRIRKGLILVLTGVVIATWTIPATVSLWGQWKWVHTYQQANVPVIYLPVGYTHAFQYLAANAKNYPTVLLNDKYSIALPSYAPVRVVSGHPIHTLNQNEKAIGVGRFLGGVMTAEEAGAYIRSHGISYIIAEETSPADSKILSYALPLTVVINKEGIVLYRVNPR